MQPGLPTASLEQMINAVDRAGTGCISIADNLHASYLGSIADTLPVTASYSSPVAEAFANPATWSRSTSSSIRSAASAWSLVTTLPTFRDLASDQASAQWCGVHTP